MSVANSGMAARPLAIATRVLLGLVVLFFDKAAVADDGDEFARRFKIHKD